MTTERTSVPGHRVPQVKRAVSVHGGTIRCEGDVAYAVFSLSAGTTVAFEGTSFENCGVGAMGMLSNLVLERTHFVGGTGVLVGARARAAMTDVRMERTQGHAVTVLGTSEQANQMGGTSKTTARLRGCVFENTAGSAVHVRSGGELDAEGLVASNLLLSGAWVVGAGSSVKLKKSWIVRTHHHGVEAIEGGHADLIDTSVQVTGGDGLHAARGGKIEFEGGRIGFSDENAAWAEDGGQVEMWSTVVEGPKQSVFAAVGPESWVGADDAVGVAAGGDCVTAERGGHVELVGVTLHACRGDGLVARGRGSTAVMVGGSIAGVHGSTYKGTRGGIVTAEDVAEEDPEWVSGKGETLWRWRVEKGRHCDDGAWKRGDVVAMSV